MAPTQKSKTETEIARGTYLSIVKRNGYEFASRVKGRGVVVLLPIKEDKKIVLVEQWREAVEKRCLELPAGLVSDEEKFEGEEFIHAAHRELEEETGYIAKEMKMMADFPTSSGMSSERVTLYLCTGLQKVSKGGGDLHENITVHEVEVSRLHKWLDEKSSKGFDIDYKIYAAMFLYEKRNQA